MLKKKPGTDLIDILVNSLLLNCDRANVALSHKM